MGEGRGSSSMEYGGGGTSSSVEKRKWDGGRFGAERKKEGDWVGSEGPKDPMAAVGEGSGAGEPEVGMHVPGEAEPRFGGEFLN